AGLIATNGDVPLSMNQLATADDVAEFLIDESRSFSGHVTIGFDKPYNKLIISSGAEVEAEGYQLAVGHSGGAPYNSLDVGGVGTQLRVKTLYVGNNGSNGNIATIHEGGVVVALQQAVIGNQTAASNNSLLISDAG